MVAGCNHGRLLQEEKKRSYFFFFAVAFFLTAFLAGFFAAITITSLMLHSLSKNLSHGLGISSLKKIQKPNTLILFG